MLLFYSLELLISIVTLNSLPDNLNICVISVSCSDKYFIPSDFFSRFLACFVIFCLILSMFYWVMGTGDKQVFGVRVDVILAGSWAEFNICCNCNCQRL